MSLRCCGVAERTKSVKEDADSLILLVLLQALDRVPLIRAIINLIIEFIHDKVAHWIIERGGWVSTLTCLVPCLVQQLGIVS